MFSVGRRFTAALRVTKPPLEVHRTMHDRKDTHLARGNLVHDPKPIDENLTDRSCSDFGDHATAFRKDRQRLRGGEDYLQNLLGSGR